MKHTTYNLRVIPHDFKVGDDVSCGFDGDWYPDGQVARITKNFLTTTKGHKYHLYTHLWCTKETNYEDVLKEGFRSVGGGTWTLTKGVIREWNPEF